VITLKMINNVVAST